MTRSLLTAESSRVKRQLRLIGLLDGAERVGMTPLPLVPLHTIAYFTDALAPVWDLPIIDGQILKRYRPYYPSLQSDLDRLVGQGLAVVSQVGHVIENLQWRLDARYILRREFADRVIAVANSFPEQQRELNFVREVVYSTSGLGVEGVESVSEFDATYADPLIDIGGMIEVERDSEQNQTVQVALRFGDLLGAESDLSMAEMVNLYVRRLYSRMQVA